MALDINYFHILNNHLANKYSIDLGDYLGSDPSTYTITNQNLADLGAHANNEAELNNVLLNIAFTTNNVPLAEEMLRRGALVRNLNNQGQPNWFAAFHYLSANDITTSPMRSLIMEQSDFNLFQRNRRGLNIHQAYPEDILDGANMDQGRLLNQVERYLNYRNKFLNSSEIDPKFIETIKKGVCYGLSTMQWFAEHATRKNENRIAQGLEPLTGIQDRAWFESMLNKLYTFEEPVSGNPMTTTAMAPFEEFISLVSTLQAPMEIGLWQTRTDVVHGILSEPGESDMMTKEFALSAWQTPQQAADTALSILGNNQDKNIMLSSFGVHVISITQYDNRNWYYDSNRPEGRVEIQNRDHLAALLQNSECFAYVDQPKAVDIGVFGFGPPGHYPNLRALLTKEKFGNMALTDADRIISASLYSHSPENLAETIRYVATGKPSWIKTFLDNQYSAALQNPQISKTMIDVLAREREAVYLQHSSGILDIKRILNQTKKPPLSEEVQNLFKAIDDPRPWGSLETAQQHLQQLQVMLDTVQRTGPPLRFKPLENRNPFELANGKHLMQIELDRGQLDNVVRLITRGVSTSDAGVNEQTLQRAIKANFAIAQAIFENPVKITNVHNTLKINAAQLVQLRKEIIEKQTGITPEEKIQLVMKVDKLMTQFTNTKNLSPESLLQVKAELIQKSKDITMEYRSGMQKEMPASTENKKNFFKSALNSLKEKVKSPSVTEPQSSTSVTMKR